MDLNKINLNYYSFGYLGGFVDKSVKKMSAEKLAQLAIEHNIGGVEFPADYLFEDNYDQLDNFLKRNNKLQFFISIENFQTERIKKIIPILKNNEINKTRIKMSNYFGGNRFRVSEFYEQYEMFVHNLISIKSFLMDHDFQLLIENHQDLNSYDILNIINTISSGCIGVNWDIGNSLPTGETPLQFYENLKDHIYNIHIKDYKLVKNENSIEFHRCIIGKGNIGINEILLLFIKNNYSHSMSIELGAYEKRVSYVFNKEYWNSYPYYDDNHKSGYFDFVNSRIINVASLDKVEIPNKKFELFQIEESIRNLKNLN